MKIRLTKRRYYRGKLYEPGTELEMPEKDAKAYIERNAAALIPGEKKKPFFARMASKLPQKETPKVTVSVEPEDDVEQDKEPFVELGDLPETEPAEELAEESEPGPESEPEVEIPLEDLKYPEIQKLAKEVGVPATGTKAIMIKRIRAFQKKYE